VAAMHARIAMLHPLYFYYLGRIFPSFWYLYCEFRSEGDPPFQGDDLRGLSPVISEIKGFSPEAFVFNRRQLDRFVPSWGPHFSLVLPSSAHRFPSPPFEAGL